ncbi:MAG: FAD-dependent oxidoreductase [Desulfobulbaceae bacterium]|nr:FAD-dependent oxidoreductase [Desulfobulbaceae bacterium]
MGEKYDAIVIGSGISGSSVGAMLSKLGYKTIVLEQSEQVGGRTFAFDGDTLTKDHFLKTLAMYDCTVAVAEPDLDTIFREGLLKGYTVDIGYHRGYTGPIIDAIKSLGGEIETCPPFEIPWDPKLGLSFPDLMEVSKRITELNPNPDDYDDVSIVEFAKEQGWDLNGNLYKMFRFMADAMQAVKPIDQTAAGDPIRSLLLRGRRQRFPVSAAAGGGLKGEILLPPKGGSDNVSKSFLNIITKNGGSVRTGAKVKKIVVEGGVATGVVVGKDELIQGKIIVYSGVIFSLPNIIEKKHLPKDYLRRIDALSGTGVGGFLMNAGFPAPQSAPAGIFSEFPPVSGFGGRFFNAVPAGRAMGCAPDGKELLFAGWAITPEENELLIRDKELTKKIFKSFSGKLSEVIAGYDKSDWKIVITCPSCYSVGSRVFASGKYRLENRVPTVGNLFLAGDGVRGAVNFGQYAAYKSAERCFAEIMGAYPLSLL